MYVGILPAIAVSDTDRKLKHCESVLLVLSEAIHNKDYSVVKTFKPLLSSNTGAFYFHTTSDFAELSKLRNENKKSNP